MVSSRVLGAPSAHEAKKKEGKKEAEGENRRPLHHRQGLDDARGDGNGAAAGSVRTRAH